jgi:hypothetical protein
MRATNAPIDNESNTPRRVVNEDRWFFLLPFMHCVGEKPPPPPLRGLKAALQSQSSE